MKQIFIPGTKVLLTLFVLTTLWLPVKAQQPVIQYSAQISTGLSNPIDIVHAGDGSNRIFIVQRGGTIRVYSAALAYLGDFLTVTGISTGGEGGLLSMAFHPDYETNGLFFVYYTLPDLSLEIARYQVSVGNANIANAASKQVVINIAHPVNTNHNGGKLNFGADGYLYLGTGDGGGGGDVPNNAQNGNSLLGKMLRLNVTTTGTAPFYTIPPTNPYIGNAGVLDEIWALGLRNPWRWSFDRATNAMWIADVGQGEVEEVNYRASGSTGGINYGWRCYEGDSAYNTTGCLPASNYIAPIFGYGHNNITGGSSITGGYVYRGTEYPALAGFYICADYVSGNQWTIGPNGAGGWNVYQQISSTFPGNIATFGEAENGTLYAASLSGNTVYKVELASVLPLVLTDFTGLYRNGASELQWKTSSEEALAHFEVEFSTDGIRYEQAGKVIAANNSTGSTYQFRHETTQKGRILYRLNMVDHDGKARYSQIITVLSGKTARNLIYPTVVHNGVLQLSLEEAFYNMEIRNTAGQLVFRDDLQGKTGNMQVPVSGLAQGMYVVMLCNAANRFTGKFIIR
jgi:glucose/arabinose dehydrogenase